MSAKNWIEFPRVEGETSRQAHADLPDGTFEREIGRDGFFGPAAHLYHRHPPTGWSSFEGPLRPRAFDALAVAEKAGDPFLAAGLLSNAHCQIGIWHLRARDDASAARCRRRSVAVSSMKARAISSAISAISPIATATIFSCRAARCGGSRRRRARPR